MDWTASNLPAADFSIHPAQEFFWKVDLISFDKEHQHLTLKVIDYYPSNIDSFKTQKLKSEIKSIEFARLDWYYLAGFLSTYKKLKLLPFIEDSVEIYVPERSKKNFHYEIKVAFKEIKFEPGKITFWTELPALSEPVEVQIFNPHVLPEFEFIKGYFANALGKKSITVFIDLQMTGNRVGYLSANSVEIDAIDENLVGTLKNTRVLGLQKSPKVVVVDKHLFTADELFDQYYDEPDSNLFHQIPIDILRNLSSLGVVRNCKQLEYLAGRKQLNDQKIMVTLAPNFGFLFITSSGHKNHFIWELINSHATYIWSFDEHLDSTGRQMKIVEEIIGMIREQGRDRYKSYYQSHLTDLVYAFNVVIHRHADLSVVDPFPGWKHRLEEILV